MPDFASPVFPDPTRVDAGHQLLAPNMPDFASPIFAKKMHLKSCKDELKWLKLLTRIDASHQLLAHNMPDLASPTFLTNYIFKAVKMS